MKAVMAAWEIRQSEAFEVFQCDYCGHYDPE